VATFMDWLRSESGQVIVAGSAGATAAAFHRWPGYFGFVRTLVIGVSTAYYLGDYATPIFKWAAGIVDLPVEKAANSGAFLVGATGVVLFETLMLAVTLKRNELYKGESHVKGNRDAD
jgi:hypothetical protein